MTTTTTVRPASAKQLALVTTLLNERDTHGTPCEGHSEAPLNLTAAQASTAITALLEMPKLKVEITPGMYTAEGGLLFRVYLGQQSGRLLVGEVIADSDGVGYKYLGSASRCLPVGARRLTVKEVGYLGKTFDHCLMCGRRLDDPVSVDRGIGPVCAAKY